MLYVSTNISTYSQFKEHFQSKWSKHTFLDLSNIPSSELSTHCKSVLEHHSNVCIFLGYLESGWMMEPTHQTILRSVIRKFPIALVCNYVESLPFSWKNEIDILYSERS
jgi:hypothetical protein